MPVYFQTWVVLIVSHSVPLGPEEWHGAKPVDYWLRLRGYYANTDVLPSYNNFLKSDSSSVLSYLRPTILWGGRIFPFPPPLLSVPPSVSLSLFLSLIIPYCPICQGSQRGARVSSYTHQNLMCGGRSQCEGPGKSGVETEALGKVIKSPALQHVTAQVHVWVIYEKCVWTRRDGRKRYGEGDSPGR